MWRRISATCTTPENICFKKAPHIDVNQPLFLQCLHSLSFTSLRLSTIFCFGDFYLAPPCDKVRKEETCAVICILIFLVPNISFLILRKEKHWRAVARRAFICLFWYQVQRIEGISLPSSGHMFWLFLICFPELFPQPLHLLISDIILFCLLWEVNYYRLHYPSSFVAWFLVSFAQWRALAGVWEWSKRGCSTFPPCTWYFEQCLAMIVTFLIVATFRQFLDSSSFGVPLIGFHSGVPPHLGPSAPRMLLASCYFLLG